MKNIVIIGGGPAGVAFAQAASKNLLKSAGTEQEVRITLIEKNEFYYHTFGSLRGLVDVSYIPKLFVPYDNIAQGINDNFVMKRATVTSIDYSSKIVSYTSHRTTLSYNDVNENDNSISYDYLILATGSSYASPIKPGSNERADIEKSIRETATKIQQSDSILVIGGGAVGIEMAGELKAYHPSKRIMLLDRHTELLSNQNVPKLRPRLQKALEEKGVELLLGQTLMGDRITKHEFGRSTLTTESGMVIQSDARLVCAGMTVNTSLMTTADPTCLNDRSVVKVKDTMQIDHPSYENEVFVLGDASDHPTPKMGYWAIMQGQHLGTSLINHILWNKSLEPFHPPTTEAILIPLGPDGGLSQLPLFGGIVMGDFFTRMMKSKSLMAEVSWKNLNAKMPE